MSSVPPTAHPDVSPSLLDRLADAGWPALEREPLGEWMLRAADGVTNRANSVLTSGSVPSLAPAVDTAEHWYSSRGLPAVFQVSRATPPGLTRELSARGYREESLTDVLVAPRAAVATGVRDAAVQVETSPSPGWVDTWWAVDGRGGDRERATVERILAGGPALYAWSGDPHRPDAVARLALVGDWGGLYAVATLPSARRRGLARALVVALAGAAAAHGVESLWLQVLADNIGAHALYARLGFRPASAYSYWIVPRPPQLTAPPEPPPRRLPGQHDAGRE